MEEIEVFIENPGDKDVRVDEVFTEKMFTELEKRMESVGWANIRTYWESDYKNRKIVTNFLKVNYISYFSHFECLIHTIDFNSFLPLTYI